MLHQPCIPGVNLTWLCYMLLDLICNYFVGIFASTFTRDINLQFSFLAMSLAGFGIGIAVAS